MFPRENQPDNYVNYMMVEDQINNQNAPQQDLEQNQEQNRRQVTPLHQIQFHSFIGEEDDFRKISMMVLQIKYETKKRDWITFIAGYSQFFLYLALQLWALVQFFIKENAFESLYTPQNNCNISLLRFIFIVVLIGFFQYLDYFMMLILVILCSVFILGAIVYYFYKNCRRKRRRNNFIKKLKPIKYNPNNIRNHQDCPICLSSFEESEKIIILPCEAQHHFHDDCIKGWLNVNSTCPMCRTKFENN